MTLSSDAQWVQSYLRNLPSVVACRNIQKKLPNNFCGLSYQQWIRVILVCFFLSLYSILFAQEQLLPVYHFQRLTAADGSFPSYIRAPVVRDSTGYVWIGTNNGLMRYDGYGFRTYLNDPTDPNSISSNIIMSLLVDSKKRLWVGTWATGLSLYDATHDRFLNLNSRPDDFSSCEIKCIVAMREDQSGNIWLAVPNAGIVGVKVPAKIESKDLDSLARRIQFNTYALRTPLNYPSDLFVQQDGKILTASDSGLISLDPSIPSLSRLDYADPLGHRLDSVCVASLFQDSCKNFWIGTSTQGVFYLDIHTKKVLNFRHREGDELTIKSDDIWDIQEDLHGNLWISTAKGISLMSPRTGKCIPYLTTEPLPSTLSWLSVDQTGTIWVSTADDGVYRLSPKSLIFPHYSYRTPDGSPQSFENIELDRDGTFWLSSFGKIIHINLSTQKVLKSIDVFQGKTQYMTFSDNKSTLLDRQGNFWYATWGLGLYKINLASSQVTNYRYESRYSKDCIVQRVIYGSGDSLWIAAYYDGLMKFDPVSGKFMFVLGTSVLGAYTSTVMQDHDGKIWVATEQKGIFVYDPVTGTTRQFVHDPFDPRSLSHDVTCKVHQDPEGRIWIGANNVINLWDPETGLFTRYANQEYVQDKWAIPIGTDRKGRLWITDGHISMLDPSSGVFTNFDQSYGLIDYTVDMENLPDGRILQSGYGGLNIFDPDSLDCHRNPPPLVLTRMTINDQPIVPSALSEGLQLSYTQNVLEFEFAAIEIDAPQLVRYQYQLEGLEKEWVKPENLRYVRYPGLDPGNYVFRVRATSIRNEWPEQEIALAISIAPPWYQTFWAYVGYLLLFIGLLFTGYRLRLRQLHLKQQMAMEHFQAEHLAEVDKLKSRFFANISHEFRTPLTLIMGPAEQGMTANKDSTTNQKFKLIRDNARKLLVLVNQLLDFSRVESGMMHLQVSRSELVPFLRRVVMSFESWAERKRITLQFQPEQESIQGYFDGDKLEKILNNLLSNALKFTPEGGRIEVSLRVRQPHDGRSNLKMPGEIVSSSGKGRTPRNDLLQGDWVEVSISDTGIGIAPQHLPHIFDRFYRVDETHSTEGTGIGLALTHELVQLHHGTITAESTPGKGSVFTLQLPIEKSAYTSDEIVEILPPSNIAGPGRLEEVVKEIKSVEGITPIKKKKAAAGKPAVLVVEDNADLRQYIRENLEPEYVVVEAADGKKGFDQAAEAMPDLVISDIMMPEMDGIELCSSLKKDLRTSHIPVILLTARAGIESKLKGLETGADDYVTKPFDARELLARVKNLIEQRQLLRKKFSTGVLLKPGEVSITALDDALLKRIMEVVEKKMGNEDFNIDELAHEVFLSRRNLERKLQALTNLSPGEFLHHLRLQRAYELLKKKAGSVTEIAYQVGFSSPAYFSSCFHERFGFPPSEIHNQKD